LFTSKYTGLFPGLPAVMTESFEFAPDAPAIVLSVKALSAGGLYTNRHSRSPVTVKKLGGGIP
jgi:hypothetical protein